MSTVVLVAETKDEAERKIGEAIRAYAKNEDVNPMLVLKLAEQHWLEKAPIEEALDVAYQSRQAFARQEAKPQKAEPEPKFRIRGLEDKAEEGPKAKKFSEENTRIPATIPNSIF
jgi:hypothetical protein